MISEEVNSSREFKGFNILRTDPFGLWLIKPIKGRLPNALSGQYTSFGRAEKDIENYIINKKE